MKPDDQLALIKEHIADQHPLLDAESCPVCEWMLKQHQQSEATA